MRNHVHKNLKFVDFIIDREPSLVVELGVFGGACTLQLLGLIQAYDFDLISVDDAPEPVFNKLPLDIADRWVYATDISYEFLDRFPEIQGIPKGFSEKIDICIIDTDHNYWTLKKELEALKPHLSDKGVILFHDTETFNDWSGFMTEGYQIDCKYPIEDIMAEIGKPMTLAITEFLDDNKDFEILRENSNFCGAMAIGRKA